MKDFPVDLMKYLPGDFQHLKKGLSHMMIIHMGNKGEPPQSEDMTQRNLNSPDEMHTELPPHPMDSMFEGKEPGPDEHMEAEPSDIQHHEDQQMEEENILNRLGKNPHANKMTKFSVKEGAKTGPRPNMMHMDSSPTHHMEEMAMNRKGKKGRY